MILSMKKIKILMPLPNRDFDPSEAGITYYQLVMNGCDVVIATPNGKVAIPDQLMLTGHGLGIFKYSLMADKNGKMACHFMQNSKTFNNPINYQQINVGGFDAIVLPGGHDKGMREYLESKTLQAKVLEFHLNKKLIAAICHGVVVLARTKDQNGKSILFESNVTALLKKQELLAYNLTKWYLEDYYLTYSITVEDEVTSVLKNKEQFKSGLNSYNWLSVSLLKRDQLNKFSDSFVLEDGNLITARWPGDAHLFAMKILNYFSK